MKEKNPTGTVIESLPNVCFKVRMDDGRELGCYLAGRMRLRNINILVGDRVEVLIDPYGGKMSNRIVWRI